MPFYIASSLKPRTVIIRSTNSPQLIICYPEGDPIHLIAFLNDYINHRNITFLWEQLKGNPVTLSATDTYYAEYPFVDTSDKIFRCWIDKGLPEQRYEDVYIYHTPYSNIGNGYKVDGKGTLAVTISNLSMELVTTTGLLSREVVPTVVGILANEVSYSLATDLESTAYEVKMEVYFDTNATHTPGILVDTFFPPYPESYIAIEGFYTFKFYYDYPNETKVFTSKMFYSNTSSSDAVESNSHTTDDLMGNVGSVIRIKNIKRFTNITKGVVLNAAGTGAFNIYLDRSKLIRFTNKTLSIDTNETIVTSTGYGNVGKDIVLTRLDQSGIGHEI